MSDIRSTYTDECNFYGRHTPRELAETFGTPLYVYNENVLRQRCRDLMGLSKHPGFGVNYSVKANATPALLRIVREEGLVVDAMSPGELYMDELAGFTPAEILYISNNNSEAELKNAVSRGLLISVDSLSQLDTLGRINKGGKVMVRFNPGIGAGHHAKVITAGKDTKFGVTPDKLDEVFALLEKHDLTLAGINQHIGSLFMEPDGYLDAAEVLLHLADRLPASMLAKLEVIDFGGGFGIPYHKYEGQARLSMADLGERLHALIAGWSEKSGYKGRFLVEPGRYVAAECCVLLGTVFAVKNNGDKRTWAPIWALTCLCAPPCTIPSTMWKFTGPTPRPAKTWCRPLWAIFVKAAISLPRNANCPLCAREMCLGYLTPELMDLLWVPTTTSVVAPLKFSFKATALPNLSAAAKPLRILRAA